MKALLEAILVVFLICTLSAAAAAQVPQLKIFHDSYMLQEWGDCPWQSGVVDTIYVGAINLNMWLSTIDFRIEYPEAGSPLTWLADVHYSPLFLGQSPTGVTITFPNPRAAFDATFVMRAVVLWTFPVQYHGYGEVLNVWPHPGKASIEVVGWPDYDVVELYGSSTIFCPLIATEETTWGKVKALYQ